MPPTPYLDIDSLDLENIIIPREEIYQRLPHRHEFMLLDGIVHLDEETGLMAGVRKLNPEEFWVRGHIPGRPLFPGVLMIETAAQLVSYYAMGAMDNQGFLGFAGVEGAKFRGSVGPGETMVMVGKMIDIRTRRCVGNTQGFVNGKMVFEGTITGMWM